MPVGVGLEFQGVMGLGVGDDIFVGGGELLEEAVGQVVADNAILSREQEQRGHGHGFGSPPQINVEANALHEKPGSGLTQRQFVVADKVAPTVHGGEQIRIVERNRE